MLLIFSFFRFFYSDPAWYHARKFPRLDPSSTWTAVTDAWCKFLSLFFAQLSSFTFNLSLINNDFFFFFFFLFTFNLQQWVEESFTNFDQGINWRSYVVCDVAYNNINNWLWTPFIERHNANRIYIEIKFSMRDCNLFPGNNNKEKKRKNKTFKGVIDI